MKCQGFCVFLLGLMSATSTEGSIHASEDPPLGLYYSQFWVNGDGVLNQSPGRLMFKLEKTGYDTYETYGSWVTVGVLFSGFYSSSTKLLSGAWYSTANHKWGALNYHWNGVTFSGRFTVHGSETMGYEIFYPVNGSFVVPEAAAF